MRGTERARGTRLPPFLLADAFQAVPARVDAFPAGNQHHRHLPSFASPTSTARGINSARCRMNRRPPWRTSIAAWTWYLPRQEETAMRDNTVAIITTDRRGHTESHIRRERWNARRLRATVCHACKSEGRPAHRLIRLRFLDQTHAGRTAVGARWTAPTWIPQCDEHSSQSNGAAPPTSWPHGLRIRRVTGSPRTQQFSRNIRQAMRRPNHAPCR